MFFLSLFLLPILGVSEDQFWAQKVTDQLKFDKIKLDDSDFINTFT